MKKYLLSSILLIAACFATQSVSAYDFSEENEDGVTIYYKIVSPRDKTCEVTRKEDKPGYGKDYMYDDYEGDIKIPSTANGYQVISIGSNAMASCQKVTSVKIPNSVTKISNFAFFWCQGLSSITIPNSVTSLESYVFCGCTSLSSLKLPNTITVLNASLLEYCTSLTSITIPSTVTEILDNALASCTGLTSITIPASVTSIGYLAFQSCTGLKNLTIPKSVAKIHHRALEGCTALESIVVEDGNPFYNSINNCNALIETSTSMLVKGCKNTVIPNTVKIIEDGAFNGCKGLTEIKIPDSVESTGLYSFGHCPNLTKVTLGNSFKTIGRHSFDQCFELTTLVMGNSVTTIESAAFQSCRKLTSVTFPNTLTTIEDYAFSGCSSMTTLTIPSSVTSIADYAFSGCSGLTSITSHIKDVFETGSKAFNLCSKATLYVPHGFAEIYSKTADWSSLTKIEEFYERIPLAMACNDKGRVVINREINFTNKMAEVSIFEGIENHFSFAPYENCELGQVLLDGLDITKSVKENHLIANIREKSHMMVIFVPKGADVNGDGQVDISDVVALVNIILGS